MTDERLLVPEPDPALPWPAVAVLRVTPNFRWGEFSISRQFPALAGAIPPEFWPTLRRLAETVLEPLRVHLDRAVHLNSGWRSATLNVAVGGSKTSQHLIGEAADIRTAHVRDVFRALYRGEPALPVGQVIYYPGRHFIHLALPGERYGEPSFHVHVPPRWRYRKVRGAAHLDRMLAEV